MKCPICKTPHSLVSDSRPRNDDASIRRRRECLNVKCNHRFTTYEEVKDQSLTDILDLFNRDKEALKKKLSKILDFLDGLHFQQD